MTTIMIMRVHMINYIWGFDCNSTNYTFKHNIEFLKQHISNNKNDDNNNANNHSSNNSNGNDNSSNSSSSSSSSNNNSTNTTNNNAISGQGGAQLEKGGRFLCFFPTHKDSLNSYIRIHRYISISISISLSLSLNDIVLSLSLYISVAFFVSFQRMIPEGNPK